jgi:hypothetical protein
MPPKNGWDLRHRALMEWLCLPEMFREPRTITALAAHIGVTREALYEWQRTPGFSEALQVTAKQTTLKLEPEFLHKLSLAMVKDNPNDRLVQVYWRYVRPALKDEQEMGEWDKILPELASDSYNVGNGYEKAVSLIRELPLEMRELFLNILDTASNHSGEQDLVPQSISVRRVYTGENEEEPPTTQELPALPAPAQDAATPRYDPQRGMRKPIRKPKPRG